MRIHAGKEGRRQGRERLTERGGRRQGRERLTGERTVRCLAHCWALDFSETAMLMGE